MEQKEQKHIVVTAGCDAELTDGNIDAICAQVRTALIEQRKDGAEMLSGLVLVGNDQSAPGDIADVLGRIAKDAYAKARNEEFNDSDEFAFNAFNAWLSVGLRDVFFETAKEE